MLLKLYAPPALYRQGNVARIDLCENDIAIRYYRPDLPALFNELSAYITPADRAELESIVAALQRRANRFGRQ